MTIRNFQEVSNELRMVFSMFLKTSNKLRSKFALFFWRNFEMFYMMCYMFCFIGCIPVLREHIYIYIPNIKVGSFLPP